MKENWKEEEIDWKKTHLLGSIFCSYTLHYACMISIFLIYLNVIFNFVLKQVSLSYLFSLSEISNCICLFHSSGSEVQQIKFLAAKKQL